jgi:L-ribulose-5-phosphate 3-epimerase
MNRAASRRQFLRSTIAAAVGAAAGSTLDLPALLAAEADAGPRLKKAVKFDMIKTPGSIEEKFNLIKSLGFQGVEINSPSDVNREEAVAARDKTGIVIHGVIDSAHWKDRLSDPDEAVRERGVAALKTAIADAKTYGATTVLLVPGKVGKDATFEQTWARSQAEIRKVLPLFDNSGAKLAIEVVWNDFLTKPEQLVKYVDEFQSPNVGAYFDVSNMIKYGVPPADWIRALGPRMLKFDFKGFSMEKFKNKQSPWVDIGEGDENWPEVLKALDEVGYRGWATSEVAGGGEKELKDIAERMNKVLGLA